MPMCASWMASTKPLRRSTVSLPNSSMSLERLRRELAKKLSSPGNLAAGPSFTSADGHAAATYEARVAFRFSKIERTATLPGPVSLIQIVRYSKLPHLRPPEAGTRRGG